MDKKVLNKIIIISIAGIFLTVLLTMDSAFQKRECEINLPTLEYDEKLDVSTIYIIDRNTADYTSIRSKKLHEEISNSKNEIATREKYVGKDIVVTGQIYSISEDSFEIMTSINNYGWNSLHIRVFDVSHKAILSLLEGEFVTVVGCCTNVTTGLLSSFINLSYSYCTTDKGTLTMTYYVSE